MNREDHLQWCKDRAIEYLDSGDTAQAYASFSSDVNKHPETRDNIAIKLGMALVLNGKLNTVPEIKKFINGFN